MQQETSQGMVSVSSTVRMTQSEHRIFQMLLPGRPIQSSVLITDCLTDEWSGVESLRVTVCRLNKKLGTLGLVIISQAGGRSNKKSGTQCQYRMARFLCSRHE